MSKFSESMENQQKSEAPEDIRQKLAREVFLLQTSIVDGFTDNALNAAQDPLRTAALTGAAAVMGFGLCRWTKNMSLFKDCVNGVGIGIGASSVIDLCNKGTLQNVSGALEDTWASKGNFESSKMALRSELGPLAFDSLLMSCAGTLGSVSNNAWMRHCAMKHILGQPKIDGKITYTLAPGVTYTVSSEHGILQSGSHRIYHPNGDGIKAFARVKHLNATEITKFSNGDKVVHEPGVKTTVESSASVCGFVPIRQKHTRFEHVDLEVDNTWARGKLDSRHVRYQKWLDVYESPGGSLSVSAYGNRRLDLDGPNDGLIKAALRKSGVLHKVLSPDPMVRCLENGQVVEFGNGAKLYLQPRSDAFIEHQGQIQCISRKELPSDQMSKNEWFYLRRTGKLMPKKAREKSEDDFGPGWMG